MWDYYFSHIVKKVFMPFIVYLFCNIYLISSIAGDYLKEIKEYETKHPGVPYFDASQLWSCGILTVVCTGFLIYF